MDTTTILSLFRDRVKHFLTCTESEWTLLTEYLNVKQLPKNQYFARDGKTCKEIGFIIKGGVRYCSVVEGREVTGYFSFQNSFVTALKSYLKEEPCNYDIKTLEETIFVTISRKDMELLFDHPELACKMQRFGRLVSESFNILFEDRLKSFIVQTPEERYLDLLKAGDEVVNHIPIQYIAQFIGITPVSLSRIRKRIIEKQLT